MVRRSSAGNRRPLLAAPFFWVAIEFLRDHLASVPWNPLGNAQVSNIPFARIAEFTGVYGLSFAIMLVNCAFTAGFLFYGRRRKNLLISATAAAVALQMGALVHPAPAAVTHQAVLVQPNLPVLDSNDWTSEFYDHTIAELAQQSVKAMPRNPPMTRAPATPRRTAWHRTPQRYGVVTSIAALEVSTRTEERAHLQTVHRALPPGKRASPERCRCPVH